MTKKLELYQDLKLKITNPTQVPVGHHWGIVVYSKKSVFHEGDQRSRDWPGHGYGEYTETVENSEHYATTDKELWEALIEKFLADKKDFIAFEVLGTAGIRLKTEINIRG